MTRVSELRFEAERHMVLKEDMAAESKKIDADNRMLVEENNGLL